MLDDAVGRLTSFVDPTATPPAAYRPNTRGRSGTTRTTARRGGSIHSATRSRGYHAVDRAIDRDGHGVAPQAILDAVRNPVHTITQASGRTRYVGRDATVVLEDDGTLVTTWATNRNGWRYGPGDW